MVLIDGHLSKQTGKSSSNCTVGSKNVALLNREDFQYEVNLAFNKKSQGNSKGVISGTEIWCDDGNLHCPVVVEATLVSGGNSTGSTCDSTGSTFPCSFNLNRTIRFDEAKMDLQIEVIIKNISDTQQNETLNFTLSTEFVKSLFFKNMPGKVNVTNCSLEATSPTTPIVEVSISVYGDAYSNGSYCPIDNITLSQSKDIQYQVINDFDERNKAGNVRFLNGTNIFCSNGSSHFPIVAKLTRANCDEKSSPTVDCLFYSNHTSKCNETKIDLQIKVIIKNISDTQNHEALNFTLSTEFLKSLFLKNMPGKVNVTNCSLEATSPTTPIVEVSVSVYSDVYSNGSYCPIDNITLSQSKDIQYQVINDFDERNKAGNVRFLNGTNIFCSNGSSHFPIVAKLTRANCDEKSSPTVDCLFYSNHTSKCNETKFDLQIKVIIKNISDTQNNEALNFTLNTEFVKSLFLKNMPGKVNVTNCSLKLTPATFTPTPFTTTSTSAIPGKKQKSKSSNGKIALVVLAFLILLCVAIIACYFKCKKKLSNQPAYYNDISLNDPLHTEIKFYKADGEDVEDNAEEDDDDDILPLI